MPVTSVELPEELRRRVVQAAEQEGKSPDAFVLRAIEWRIEQAEKRASFLADADAALEEMERTGLAYEWEDVREYARALAAGEKPERPQAKPWRK